MALVGHEQFDFGGDLARKPCFTGKRFIMKDYSKPLLYYSFVRKVETSRLRLYYCDTGAFFVLAELSSSVSKGKQGLVLELTRRCLFAIPFTIFGDSV